jgi:3-methyladenine DNA glycosylase AlkD
MKHSQVVLQVREDLKANVDEKTKRSFQRFFKEQVKCYGVKTATVTKIAAKHWREVKNLGKPEIFGFCEQLFQSDFTEEAFVVSSWLPNMVDRFERSDLQTFRCWIERYIDNWAKCDSFCNHAVGEFIEMYPDCIGEVKSWTKSENRWLKRAAAVSLIVPAKQGEFLQDALEISSVLLLDGDDMVQKGYGWLLKEESRKQEREVFNFVMRNRQIMPRTALRYAIELMPKELKLQAMSKV